MYKTNPQVGVKIANPVAKAKTSQYFGKPKTDYLARAYRSFGLICQDDKSELYKKPFHNGIDFGTVYKQKCYCVYPSVVTGVHRNSVSAGNFVELTTDTIVENGMTYKLKFRYLHLHSFLVKKGQRLNMGAVIGYCDSTGFSTGNHLHFDVALYKETVAKNFMRVNNGWSGFINPQELFTDINWNKLPVDKQYGRKRNFAIEYTFRFAAAPAGVKLNRMLKGYLKGAQYVHRTLLKRGRSVPLLTNRESNALIYGGWDLETVLNPAGFSSWGWYKKAEITEAIKNGTPLGTPLKMGGDNE